MIYVIVYSHRLICDVWSFCRLFFVQANSIVHSSFSTIAAMSLPDLLDLACPIQRMGFGPCGHDSLAYRLFLQGHHDTVFGLSSDDGNTPFAELWMGATHEKGVSKVRKPAELAGRDLSSVLLDDEGEHFLGPKLLKKFPKMAKRVHAGVPFVFKVLSAGKALPLQVHPDEKLSEQLRNKGKTESEDISVVDSMHKPEVSVPADAL